MDFALYALLGTVLVLGSFGSATAGSCSGDVGTLTLREDEITSNLYVIWSEPMGETGCTYTVTYTSNAPGAEIKTFETEELYQVVDEEFLVPCSLASVTVSTSDGPSRSAELTLNTRTSTAPLLIDMVTSCDSIEMTWEGQPYKENMCEHTHFQLFCLSDTHNFTVPQQVTDVQERSFHIRLTTVLRPDILYTCNGYMFVTLAGFTPASEDLQFWSNLDSVRALALSETETAIRAEWEPPLNSEECGVAYYVTYENEVLGEKSQETENLYLDLDAEIIPCTEYKVSVTPISFTGSHGTYVTDVYEPIVTQTSVDDLAVNDDGEKLTLSWAPINVGKCDIKLVVEHYVDGELKETIEPTGSSVDLDRIPCSLNTFEVSVVSGGTPGEVVSLELNLSASDIQEISQVQNLQVSEGLATWDPPVSVGRCGVMYEVTHDSEFGSTTNVVSDTEAPLTLVPCSENAVTVRGIAGTMVGEPLSLTFNAEEVELGPPENLRTVPDFTMATLTIQAEGRDINSCPISEALVTCSPDGSDDSFGISIDVTDNDDRIFDLELLDLETDTIYDCTLKWSNSERGNNIRFRTIPIPNKQLSVTDVTPNGFTVVWTEDYGAEFVLGYELVINSNGPAHEVKEGCDHETSNTFVFNLGAGDENQVFVEGFPDFDYDMSLKTVYNLGSLGVTDQSEELATLTLSDAPAAPEDLQIEFEYEAGEVYDVTGVITWAAPCELNGSLRSFGVKVSATFELGGTEQTLDYTLDIEAASPNDVFTYRLENINPFFKYVVAINTVAASEGPSAEIVINPPDICSCPAD